MERATPKLRAGQTWKVHDVRKGDLTLKLVKVGAGWAEGEIVEGKVRYASMESNLAQRLTGAGTKGDVITVDFKLCTFIERARARKTSTFQLICSNRPRPSVQKTGKGHQHWRRDVHHAMQPPSTAGRDKRTLCGRDAADWIVIGLCDGVDAADNPDLCKRCSGVIRRAT